MNLKILRPTALALLIALIVAGCSPRTERAPDAADAGDEDISRNEPAAVEPAGINTNFGYITGHIKLPLPQELLVIRPAGDFSTDAQAYYLTGSSDPQLPLTLNGEPVEDRGHLGSFGVYASLEWGENVFTFSQGETSRTVTITRAQRESTTNTLTRPSPSYDVAVRSGQQTILSCVAPSGSEVTAQLQGRTVQLNQNSVTETTGVPATYSAAFVPDETAGTVDAGPVVYTLLWNGEETTHPSQGSVFIAGSTADLLVRALDVSSTTFADENTEDDYHTPLARGAVDVVEEIGASRYRLGMGGWINKDMVAPLTGGVIWQNEIAGAQYTARDTYEMLVLQGTAPAPYSARREDGTLHLTFYHTSGPETLDLSGSALFSGAQAARQDDSLTLSFTQADPSVPVGYLVQYMVSDTVILFMKPAAAAEGERALEGVTILLDAGHGGEDDGTAGIARDNAAGTAQDDGPPVEKDITLATTVAVQKYLEAYGATVVLSRNGDETLDNNQRLNLIQQPGVDLALSLHCNSVAAGSDGTEPNGVEIHFFDEISRPLAQALLDNICAQTGRRSRGVYHSYYKVILSPNTPSALVEMGFLSNPAEYDKLCDPQEIYKVAQAITEAVIQVLQ